MRVAQAVDQILRTTVHIHVIALFETRAVEEFLLPVRTLAALVDVNILPASIAVEEASIVAIVQLALQIDIFIR